MTGPSTRRLAVLLALFCAGPAAAAPTAVLSSDSGHYRQALEGFTEAWGSTVPVVAADAPFPAEARVFVAFGSKAAAREWPRDSFVVVCLTPSVAAVPDDPVTHVSLLPDPEMLVKRMLDLVPTLKTLRLFWSSETSRDDAEELVRAGARRGVAVLSERVSPPARLPEFLRGLHGKADALWLMPDPALVNEGNFAVLREYASAEKVPLLAPIEGLAERGAAATIAVSFREMGRVAAGTLRARLDGRAEPEFVRAGRVSVTVNAAAARAAAPALRIEAADKVLP